MDADKKRIWIRGQYVEVTDEVYRAYMQGDRKMRYFENDLKTERFVLGKEGQVVQIIPSREDWKVWRAWCFTSWKWTGYIPRFPCWLQKNVR